MGYATNLIETPQMMINSDRYMLDFPTYDQQNKLFEFLKEHDPSTYNALDSGKRILFLPKTGNNFRASAKMPTEQVSVLILNSISIIGSPYL